MTSRTPTPRTVETWGVYDPGDGFLVGRNEFGELSISAYAMARYMSQHDDDQVFTDHLGNERPVDIRSDLFSHRIMVFLKGWMGSEKLIYNITLWTVNTTDQDAIFANLGYQFSRKFSLYAGLTGNPGSRSLNGSHPFWLAHDRVMADEFFRPFFGSGIFATGEAIPGLWYSATVSNNNSSLGVKASQLDRKYTYGGTVWWMPTTHEFGPRGGYGDWEWHEELATRFGMSYVDSPEQSFRDSSDSPENTTLRLADSVNLFETGALAPGVTIENADYRVLALDAGLKYKGIFLQAEYYQRWLDEFDADGLLPVAEIKDTGFYVQAIVLPDQAEARAVRRHLADLRRRRRGVRRQLRVRHRHELVSVPDAQPPAQRAAARRQQVAGEQHVRVLHGRPGRVDAGVVVLDLLLTGRFSHA